MKFSALSHTRFIAAAVALAGLACIGAPVRTPAATANGPMNVTASVAKSCVFTTGTLAFGNYDPTVTNAASGADLKVTDSTTALSINCTTGVTATMTLNNGVNTGASCSGTGPACLTDGSGDYLNYGVYTNNTFGTLWTGATTVSYTSAGAGATPIKINGDIYKGQNVPVGSYTDTITATATY